MKETIKMIVSQFFVISVAVLFFSSFLNFINGNKFLPIEYPFQVLLTGILTSIPSLIFHFRKEPSQKQFLIRYFIHFCLIVIIVMAEGAWFGWYYGFFEGIIVFITVIMVYAIVCLYTFFENKTVAKNINDALERFHKQENSDDINI